MWFIILLIAVSEADIKCVGREVTLSEQMRCANHLKSITCSKETTNTLLIEGTNDWFCFVGFDKSILSLRVHSEMTICTSWDEYYTSDYTYGWKSERLCPTDCWNIAESTSDNINDRTTLEYFWPPPLGCLMFWKQGCYRSHQWRSRHGPMYKVTKCRLWQKHVNVSHTDTEGIVYNSIIPMGTQLKLRKTRLTITDRGNDQIDISGRGVVSDLSRNKNFLVTVSNKGSPMNGEFGSLQCNENGTDCIWATWGCDCYKLESKHECRCDDHNPSKISRGYELPQTAGPRSLAFDARSKNRIYSRDDMPDVMIVVSWYNTIDSNVSIIGTMHSRKDGTYYEFICTSERSEKVDLYCGANGIHYAIDCGDSIVTRYNAQINLDIDDKCKVHNIDGDDLMLRIDYRAHEVMIAENGDESVIVTEIQRDGGQDNIDTAAYVWLQPYIIWFKMIAGVIGTLIILIIVGFAFYYGRYACLLSRRQRRNQNHSNFEEQGSMMLNSMIGGNVDVRTS